MTTRNAAKPPGPEPAAGHEPVRPRSARQERGFEIVIDRAVEYALRLVPSGKVLGRYPSTREAWPAVVAAVDGGRAPRLLVLDWVGADGSRGRVSSGVTLEYLARSGLGIPAEHLRLLRR
jgi:hypothetical protein